MRRYYVRSRFFQRMIDSNYQPKSILLKRNLIGYKLSCVSDKYTRAIDKRHQAIKNIVTGFEKHKFDHDVLMASYVKNVERMAKKNRDNPRNPLNIIEQITLKKVDGEFRNLRDGGLDDKWKKCMQKAINRCDVDCSICFQNLDNGKPLYVLNCTHLFHATCLTSFEMYSGDHNNSDHQCPMCRQVYEKKPLVKMPGDGLKIEEVDEGIYEDEG